MRAFDEMNRDQDDRSLRAFVLVQVAAYVICAAVVLGTIIFLGFKYREIADLNEQMGILEQQRTTLQQVINVMRVAVDSAAKNTGNIPLEQRENIQIGEVAAQ